MQAYAGPTTHANVLRARLAYAQALAAPGLLDKGIHQTRRAIDDSAALFSPESRTVGLDLVRLTRLQFRRGDSTASLDTATSAHSILSSHFDNQKIGFAGLLELCGAALIAVSRPAEAVADLTAPEALFTRAFGPNHVKTLRVRSLLSEASRPRQRS